VQGKNPNLNSKWQGITLMKSNMQQRKSQFLFEKYKPENTRYSHSFWHRWDVFAIRSV